MSERNISQLADLLAATVGIKPSKQPEQTIERAIEALKSNSQTKSIGKQVEDDVTQAGLTEDIGELYVSNVTPPFWDYIRMKYLGFPDVKSWAEIDRLNLKALHPDDQVDEQAEDTFNDDEIVDFIGDMTVDDYLDTVYDSDELDYTDDQNDDEIKSVLQCPICAQFAQYTNADLLKQLGSANIDSCCNADQLVEALTVQQRLKKALKMRSKAAIIAMRRKLALKKHATAEKLRQRARRLAIRMLKSRYSGGKRPDELSYTDRARLEKIVDQKKTVVDSLANRMLPIVKKIEQQRLSHTTPEK